MKILVFTSRDHFHAPIILRELALKRKEDEIIVATTPKLGNKGSPFSRISRIIHKSGADYFFSLIIAKICYSFFALIERFILARPFSERKYISIAGVINYFNIKHLSITSINKKKNIELIKELQPDMIITILFNQILKEELLKIPRYGAINIHPAYLPYYRGFSPCFWVLVNNEKETGVSIHYLTKGIDDGPILWQDKVRIEQNDSFFTLYRRCALKEAEALPDVLDKVKRGEKGIPQNESKATYFSVLTPKSVRYFRKRRHKFAWIF
jgi:folate-dependent phosphoribosylglycinamide formyltransferase PurN